MLIVPAGILTLQNGGISMSTKYKFLHTVTAVFLILSLLFPSMVTSTHVQAASSVGFVVLNSYSRTMKIGEEFYLAAFTSNGKKPSFTSNNSKVASVNTYGKITAKKAGTAKITAKIKNGEASCTIKVESTKITLSAKHISLENGYSAKLSASSSTGHPITFRSNKKSIAEINSQGIIIAKKPGSTTITASVDNSFASCTVYVKSPRLILNKSSISLYRNRMFCLSVKSTSKSIPKWKSNRKSVAVVDNKGTVTALKNGTAIITVTVDDVSKTCEVIVKKPVITFEKSEITLTAGKKKIVNVSVSSGNKPTFSSSNTCIATVDENGTIYGHDAGKAYIYASEDGVKSRIRVTVKKK